MPNPPTQGREAIERGAKALMDETALRVHGYTYCCGITRLVLDAAYPQQTEGRLFTEQDVAIIAGMARLEGAPDCATIVRELDQHHPGKLSGTKEDA